MQTRKTYHVWIGIVFLLLVCPSSSYSEERTSQNDPAIKKWLKKQPQADANGDGVLTQAEAMAFRKNPDKDTGAKAAKAGGRDSAASTPTLSNVSYGPHPRDVLDLWKAESKAPSPVLIFFHGGSFKAGDKSVVLNRPLFGDCLEAGVSVVSANYRFSSDAPYPAPMLDGARAVQFVRSKAKEWNIDPSKVALSGSSAGGTMALWIALHDDLANPKSDDPIHRQSTRVRCVAAYSAPSTIAPEILRARNAGVGMLNGAIAQLFGVATGEDLEKPENRKRLLDFCPLTHATKDDPPLYVSYQGDETEGATTSTRTTTSTPSTEGGAPKASSIHDVSLGLPLKEKYDALGLEFHIFSRSKPIPPKGEVQFLLKHFAGR